MKVINFAEQNSVINKFMAELRDKNYQRNRLTFRHNVERIGEMMAYEISKTLEYKPKNIKTPLGQLDIPLFKEEDMVIATVLRAGLPFHHGFLNVFDGADNAFVSAFRMYLNREHTEVGVGALGAGRAGGRERAVRRRGAPHAGHGPGGREGFWL